MKRWIGLENQFRWKSSLRVGAYLCLVRNIFHLAKDGKMAAMSPSNSQWEWAEQMFQRTASFSNIIATKVYKMRNFINSIPIFFKQKEKISLTKTPFRPLLAQNLYFTFMQKYMTNYMYVFPIKFFFFTRKTVIDWL